jgi:hypothetical protein
MLETIPGAESKICAPETSLVPVGLQPAEGIVCCRRHQLRKRGFGKISEPPGRFDEKITRIDIPVMFDDNIMIASAGHGAHGVPPVDHMVEDGIE